MRESRQLAVLPPMLGNIVFACKNPVMPTGEFSVGRTGYWMMGLRDCSMERALQAYPKEQDGKEPYPLPVLLLP